MYIMGFKYFLLQSWYFAQGIIVIFCFDYYYIPIHASRTCAIVYTPFKH